jgi:hypothetical protein
MRYLLIIGIAIGIPCIILAFIIPLGSSQDLLWSVAFLFFVVGDSVTTSLIQRYDNLEEIGPATRKICGSNPSSLCSFATRILFFVLLLLAYLLILNFGFDSQNNTIMVSALSFPLVLAVSGVLVVFWNSYVFLREEYR